MLLTFEEKEFRSCSMVHQWYGISLPLMSSYNKTEAAIIPIQVLLRTLSFFRLIIYNVLVLTSSSVPHTDLCVYTSSHETFLLGAAAIANITFMDSATCDVLQQLDAPKVLIQASNTNKAKSLFVKDQVCITLVS